MAAADSRKRFVQLVSGMTGLDYRVIYAWTLAEESQGLKPPGQHNWLNLRTGTRTKGYSGVPVASAGAGFASFGSVDDAAREAAFWIKAKPQYSAIRSSAGRPPGVQLLAIIRSPWAAGHYNGGRSLMAAFKRAPGGGGASSTGQELIAGSIPNPADPFGMNPFAPDKIPVPGLPWDVPSGRDALGGLLGLLPGADSLQQEGSKVATGIAAVFIRLVLAVVVLGLAAALFYNGVRRLSGDRLPSPSDVARSRVPVM